MQANSEESSPTITVLVVGDRKPYEHLFAEGEGPTEYSFVHAPTVGDAVTLLVREGYRFRVALFDVETSRDTVEEGESPMVERHLTGQQLCEASRLYALEQYGLLAKTVLKSWGIHGTTDLGEVVYNLIRIDLMKKSERDRREDFDEVFDFDQGFDKAFGFSAPGEIGL